MKIFQAIHDFQFFLPLPFHLSYQSLNLSFHEKICKQVDQVSWLSGRALDYRNSFFAVPGSNPGRDFHFLLQKRIAGSNPGSE